VPAAASGNLLTGTVPSSFGADGGYVSSISVGPDGDVRTFTYDPATDAVTASGTGGSTHLFNAAENQLTVMTEQGGKFIVDLDDGQYSYAPPVNVTGNSVTETVGFVLTDGDKDISSPGQLTLTVNLDSGALEVQGTSSANTITGTAVDEIISGLGGGDTLSGSGGDDWLSGGSSGDALLGGKGSDQLYGGSGGDTFKWALGDASEANTVDTITDFSKANGDVLDLKDLLQGESGLATLLGSPGVAGHENLNSFLTFAHEGANTVLTVDANGSTTGGDAQKVVFENTDLFNQFSATDSADLVNKMLQSGNLKTDV
jgi:Ca2+-binding RTX toxin-like protein